MFLLTYVPQLALLALTSGPLVAPVSAALLVIRESSAITAFISSSSSLSRFILPSSSRSSGVAPSAPSLDLDAFDATLILKGHESLVAGGREIRSARSANVLSRLGGLVGMSSSNNVKSTTSVTSTSPINRLIRSVLYLPLNFVPVVGTLLFLAIEGKRAGQGALDRYFELKGFTSKERDEWLEGHEGDYIRYFLIDLFLPPLSLLLRKFKTDVIFFQLRDCFRCPRNGAFCLVHFHVYEYCWSGAVGCEYRSKGCRFECTGIEGAG